MVLLWASRGGIRVNTLVGYWVISGKWWESSGFFTLFTDLEEDCRYSRVVGQGLEACVKLSWAGLVS